MKTDIRTKYTKKVIQDAFFALLKETPLNKITVKAICEKAEINRTTFYRYYQDPFDLMDQIEDELLGSFREYAASSRCVDTKTAIEAMFSAIMNKPEVYQILISDRGDRMYIHRMITETYDIFRGGMERRHPALSDSQRRWLYCYITQGCINITIDWLNRGMQESPAEMAAFIAEMDEAVLEHKYTFTECGRNGDGHIPEFLEGTIG